MAFLTTPTDTVERLYFLGIGGIAMGSVAIACRQLGYDVSGSDSGVFPPMSDLLNHHGIEYDNAYTADHLLGFAPDIVVVGNAVSRGNPALEIALDRNYPLISMPELLRWRFMQRSTRIVVSGTHGKTTTTNLIAWILHQCGAPCGYLIGGATRHFDVSCRPAPEGGYFVLEGDEYDTAFFDKRSKFLHSLPHILVITSIEYDHADIFPNYESVLSAFRQLVRQVPQTGALFICADDSGASALTDNAYAPVYCYGMWGNSDWKATILEVSPEGTSFSLHYHGCDRGIYRTQLFGEHNVRNVTAAIAVGFHLGLDPARIAAAVESFQPPRRRFEVICQWRDATVVDDFAHHPTAIAATLAAARQRYPHQRIIACFEPRSNTSARSIFQEEFAEALANADVAIVCPVYRAERYSPDQRLDRQCLCEELHQRGIPCFVLPDSDSWAQHAIDLLRSIIAPGDVVLLLSNGNLGGLRKLILADMP